MFSLLADKILNSATLNLKSGVMMKINHFRPTAETVITLFIDFISLR